MTSSPGQNGAALEPGTLVGEYQVTHLLGEGGMGIVYAGQHPEIGKRVAIKVLAPYAASHPDLIRRFKEEARAVNRIRHPNIIDIFAFNQLPDGRHYFVMEYLDGESLAARLGRAPIAVGEARGLLAQICDALEAAHRAGVIHRDLKPDNIWVAVEGTAEPRVKLLDFGIAKLNDLTAGKATQAGTQLGTPHYMPPEQGMGREIDPRADVYALGVILYEMFAGVLPFNGVTTHEIVLKHVTQPPVPPSRHRPIFPPEMEAIILACLEKAPAQRPASAKELAARIEAAFAAAASRPDAPQTIGPAAARPVRAVTPGTAILPEGERSPAREPVRTVAMPSEPMAPVRGRTSPMPVVTTTLRASTGQLTVAEGPEGGAVPARSPGRRPWPILALAAAAVVGGAIYLGVGRPHPAALSSSPPATTAPPVSPPAQAAPVEAPPPTAPPAAVAIQIDSRPSGARVIDTADGSVLGRTPFSASRPRSDGALGLRLELDGYRPRMLSVPLGANFNQRVELEKHSRSASRTRSASPPPLPASPAAKPAPQIEWE